MEKASRSPVSNRLDFLLGEWRNTLEPNSGSTSANGPEIGRTSYAWGVGGVWLLSTTELDLPDLGSYAVQGGLGYNPKTGQYQAFAVNSLGALMIYTGQWEDPSTLVFTLANPGAEGTGRVIYQALPGGQVEMRSERLAETGEFETYFRTRMIRTAG